MFRHNQIGKYIHWNILKDMGKEVTVNWLHHKLLQSISWNCVHILWDVPIITDRKVKCNRPDIVVHDTNIRECTIIDVAVPSCTNVVAKTSEKLCKYKDLDIKIQKF